MSNDLIKKDYLKKIKLIQKYNKYYYDKDKPIVTDQKYDLLKKEIIDGDGYAIVKIPNLKKFENLRNSFLKKMGFDGEGIEGLRKKLVSMKN